MINLILLCIPVFVLLTLSSALTQKFNYQIEHSNFLVMCSITLFLILTGLIGILNIGFYIIITLSLISFVYLIISKFDIRKLLTPSIVFYIIGVFIFSFLIRNIGLFWHDEISHWALATKSMYYTNDFYKGLQTMLTPTFNYFITKCSGFSTEHMYTGAWMLLWTSFLLPAGGTKWANWKRVVIYMVAAYCISGYMIKDVMFHIDELLGIMSGCLVAYWAIQKNKGVKEYTLALLGLLSISQIKDSYGALSALVVVIIIVVSEIIEHHHEIKKTFPKLMIILFSPVLGYFISKSTLNKPEGYLSGVKLSDIPLINEIFKSKIFILLISILIIILIIYIITLSNKKRINYKVIKIYYYEIFGIASIVLLLLIAYKLSMLFLQTLSYDESMAFIKAWKDFFYSTSGGSTNLKTAVTIIILIGFACGFVIKKEFIKLNIVRCIILSLGILVMGFIVLVAFSLGFDETGMYKNSVSWERYTSIPFIILISYITGYFILAKNIYIKNKYRILTISLCMLFIIKYIPYPGAIMYSRYSKERTIMSSISHMVKDDGDIIRKYLDENETVFVASYINEFDLNEYGDSRTKWLKYDIAPIISNWNYFKEYNEEIGFEGTIEQYNQRISKYDYYYVHSAGPLFYNKFGSIFPNNKLYWSKALYKIVNSNGNITLEPIYVEEDNLIS